MAEPFDREDLLIRAAQLFGESWRGTRLKEMTDDQLESLLAETEASQSFWEIYDREVRELSGARLREEKLSSKTIRPHQILGFDTADLDGQ